MISDYLKKVQRILGDTVFERFNAYDLLDYINEARQYVAAQGECIRVLCPSTASLSLMNITNGGSGYTTAPTVSITPPQLGTPATAVATVAGGHVFALNFINPGSGYTAPPSITFTGGGGTGAAATAVLQPFAQCIAGQEVYNYTSFNGLIASVNTGAASILTIKNIAVSWGSMKPALRYMAWGDFQAYRRSYNVAAQGFPDTWSTYQRGDQGSFYLWPVPSQNAQMDLDCICLPAPLDFTTDLNVEPIGYPWNNAVAYKAAEIACLGETDLRQVADKYTAHFERRMEFAAAMTAPQSFIPDYYNRSARV